MSPKLLTILLILSILLTLSTQSNDTHPAKCRKRRVSRLGLAGHNNQRRRVHASQRSANHQMASTTESPVQVKPQKLQNYQNQQTIQTINTPKPYSGLRSSRFLPLFTVIQFNNQECTSTGGDNGTCLTTAECLEHGGNPNGPCANGYGTCCLFLVTCGQTTSENGTYFVNSGYPKPYDGTGSCQLTLTKSHPDVCQFRLDFDQFTIMGPEAVNNVCNNDQFIVSGGNPVPAICGINSNSHMYIDAGLGPTNPLTLTVVTSGPSYPRLWKIKITQIQCNTVYKAEEGCLQYYTGVSGTIKSFNYDPNTGLQLSNQDYSICIRMERNFCGIQYSTCDDNSADALATNRSRAFTLSGNSNGEVQAMTGSGQQPNACNNDWLGVACATNVGRPLTANNFCVDRVCGGTLSTDISLIPSTIMSSVKPFRLTFHTDNIEAPNDVNNRGFCLNYIQQPCTNVLS